MRSLFAVGSPIGRVGSVALVLCAIGAWLVHVHHLFWPLDVTGMILVGLGTATLDLAQKSRSVGSSIPRSAS